MDPDPNPDPVDPLFIFVLPDPDPESNFELRIWILFRILILTVYQRFKEISEKGPYFIILISNCYGKYGAFLTKYFFEWPQKFLGRIRIGPDS